MSMNLEPHLPIPRPPATLSILGGVIGTLLLSAFIYLSPLVGLRFVDYPLLIGGAFSNDPNVALWLGYWIFFLFGAVIYPLLLDFFWTLFPGKPSGFIGPLTKGLVWGVILWVISGLVAGIFGALNRLPAPGFMSPGFFVLSAGIPAVLGNLVGHIIYVIAMILITAMSQGIRPVDTLGWPTYHKAEVPELVRGLPQDLHDQKVSEH